MRPYTFEHIPAEMKAIAHFCVFRKVWNEKLQKFSKLPHQVRAPQYGASSTNLEHWTSFDAAISAYEARVICGRVGNDSGADPAPCDAIGSFFTKPCFGIALNHPRNNETQVTAHNTLKPT